MLENIFTRIIAVKDGKLFFDLPVHEVTDSLLTELYSLEELASHMNLKHKLQLQSTENILNI